MEISALRSAPPVWNHPRPASGEALDRFQRAEPPLDLPRPTPAPDLTQELQRLHRLDFQATLGTITYFEAEFTPEPDLERIARAVGNGPVPAPAAVAVACLAHAFLRRAEKDMPPGHRAREPVEQDHKWARAAVDLLETWRDSGQIQAPQELERRLKRARPSFQDNTLGFAAPKKSPGELYHELPAQSHIPAPALDKLNAANLAELLDQLDLVGDGDDMYRATRVLTPELKPLLEPHKDRFLRISSRAQAQGRLAWNFYEGRNKVHVLRAATALWGVDERIFHEEIKPLLLCDELNTSIAAAELLRDLWPDNPSLVAPTLDALTGTRLNDAQFALLRQAAEKHDWAPTPRQMAWLEKELEVPKDQSLYRFEGPAEYFRKTLKVLATVNQRHPEAIPAHLPGKVLQRLLTDPSPEKARGLLAEPPPNRVDFYRMINDVAGLVFPQEGDSPLAHELMQRVRETDGLAELAMLAGLKLNTAQELELGARLEPEMFEGPPGDKRDLDVRGQIVERFRPAQIEARMNEGSVRQALLLAYYTPDEKGWEPSRPDRAVTPVLARARAISPPEQPRQLLDALPASLRDLGELTLDQLADLELAHAVTRRRPERAEWDARFRGAIKQAYKSPLVEGVARRLRRTAGAELLDELKDRALSAEQRLELLEEGRKLGVSPEAAFREGVGHRAPWLKEHEELRAALEHLRDDPEAWQRFERIHEIVGDRFEDVMNASRSLEAALGEGASLDEAWAQAMQGWLLGSGTADGQPGGVVSVSDDHVRVGSVRVPRRRDRTGAEAGGATSPGGPG